MRKGLVNKNIETMRLFNILELSLICHIRVS